MGKHAKTLGMIDAARKVLTAHHPMTVRQVYYQLVSGQVIENNRSQYQATSNVLVDARKEGVIPWEWIEDRLRRPRHVSMWDDLAAFAQTALRAYRRDVWAEQDRYLEVWLEKDALSGIFEDALQQKNMGEVMSNAWKAAEKQAAQALGGTRNQRGVDFSESMPDVEHSLFAVEVKYRKTLPRLLRLGLEQANDTTARSRPSWW